MLLINKTNVKKHALWAAGHYRPFVGFTRVSDSFLRRIDHKLLNLINEEIRCLPSKGVTIK
jgi:hypothetical protein